MNTNKQRQVARLCAPLAILLAFGGIAEAKTLNYSGAKSGSVGNSQAGASYALNGAAYANDASTANEAYVRLWGNATAKLLGKSGQLASLDGKVQSQKNKGTLKVLVKACGFNVVNTSQSFQTGVSKSYSKTYSATFLSARATFWVSIVPVTFSGNVGGGASMKVTCRIGPMRADMAGGPKAWGSASASAGVGAFGFRLASVGTTAKLMDSYLRSTAGIGFLAGQKKGGVYLDLTPLNASLWYKVLGFAEQSIAEWSTGRNTYTLATIK